MFSVPMIAIIKRSMPAAIPPCGGTPYSKASSRWPNWARIFSRLMPRISKTRSCSSRSWIRMLPPDTSTPFSTQSYARARTSYGLVPNRSISSRHGKAAHHAARVERAAEHCGGRLAQGVAHVGDHEVVAQVWLVGAVLQQRLLHVEARERSLDVDAEHVLPHARPQALDEPENVLLCAERHLDVELRDLDDAIRAEVL